VVLVGKPALSAQPGHVPSKGGTGAKVVSQGVKLLVGATRSLYSDCSRLEPVFPSLRLVLGTVGTVKTKLF